MFNVTKKNNGTLSISAEIYIKTRLSVLFDSKCITTDHLRDGLWSYSHDIRSTKACLLLLRPFTTTAFGKCQEIWIDQEDWQHCQKHKRLNKIISVLPECLYDFYLFIQYKVIFI